MNEGMAAEMSQEQIIKLTYMNDTGICKGRHRIRDTSQEKFYKNFLTKQNKSSDV